MTSDEITLTLPRHKPFFRIAHLVLGGLAVRLDVTYEHLEDLQLGLAGLLDRRTDDDGDITVSLRVEGERIETSVGPFDGAALRREFEQNADGDIGLRRLLETVADRVELSERDGGHWVQLTKTVQMVRD